MVFALIATASVAYVWGMMREKTCGMQRDRWLPPSKTSGAGVRRRQEWWGRTHGCRIARRAPSGDGKTVDFELNFGLGSAMEGGKRYGREVAPRYGAGRHSTLWLSGIPGGFNKYHLGKSWTLVRSRNWLR